MTDEPNDTEIRRSLLGCAAIIVAGMVALVYLGLR